MKAAAILAPLFLFACEAKSKNLAEQVPDYAPVGSIGPAAPVIPVFEARCQELRQVGRTDRAQEPGEREWNIESDIPADAISLRLECEDRETGARVVAHLHLEPGKVETTQVEALLVDLGAMVRFDEALLVARDYLAPLLTDKQRGAIEAMAKRFRIDWDRRGFRIDTIGVSMGHLGVEVMPYTRRNAIEMMDDWAAFERRGL